METLKPYDIVRHFEESIAEYCGSDYAVAVESCTAALFLSCVYVEVKETWIPNRTYPSVPCSIIHAGGTVKFGSKPWNGVYELAPYCIWDSALRFKKNMFRGGYNCLSFHIKKHIPIGRGGMILTNDESAYKWFKKARFDGRDEIPLEYDQLDMLGWNMYMTPEQAAKGIQLFSLVKDKDLPDLDFNAQGYPDLSKYPIYTKARYG